MTLRVNARELTRDESLSLIPWNNTQKVKTFMEEETDIRALSFIDRLAFGALRGSCLPLTEHIKKIDGEANDYPDQSKNLFQLYALCSEGTMNLTRLYIKTKKPE